MIGSRSGEIEKIGEVRGAERTSASFQLAPRIAADWNKPLDLRGMRKLKHAHHWAASPSLFLHRTHFYSHPIYTTTQTE